MLYQIPEIDFAGFAAILSRKSGLLFLSQMLNSLPRPPAGNMRTASCCPMLARALTPRARHRVIGVLIFAAVALAAFGQAPKPAEDLENPWIAAGALPTGRRADAVGIRATKFKALDLNHARLRKLLDAAPNEKAQAARKSPAQIRLPMPDGSFARFSFVEAPVMEAGLAAKFPEIKTYFGQGIDDPDATVRFDLTPAGFHAQILSPHGAVYIDPAFRGENGWHTSYYKRDYFRADDFHCWFSESSPTAGRGAGQGGGLAPLLPAELARSGSNLRTYRLACAATAEYTTFHGGTVVAGMSAIVTAINRVTGVYETEVAIRLDRKSVV